MVLLCLCLKKGHLLRVSMVLVWVGFCILDWRDTMLSVFSSLVYLKKLIVSPTVWQLFRVDVSAILKCGGVPLIRIFLMPGSSGTAGGAGLLW